MSTEPWQCDEYDHLRHSLPRKLPGTLNDRTAAAPPGWRNAHPPVGPWLATTGFMCSWYRWSAAVKCSGGVHRAPVSGSHLSVEWPVSVQAQLSPHAVSPAIGNAASGAAAVPSPWRPQPI